VQLLQGQPPRTWAERPGHCPVGHHVSWDKKTTLAKLGVRGWGCPDEWLLEHTRWMQSMGKKIATRWTHRWTCMCEQSVWARVCISAGVQEPLWVWVQTTNKTKKKQQKEKTNCPQSLNSYPGSLPGVVHTQTFCMRYIHHSVIHLPLVASGPSFHGPELVKTKTPIFAWFPDGWRSMCLQILFKLAHLLIFFLFFGTGVWTHGLTLAKQVLYHMSH
jgi:hypothetical protein